MTEPVLLQLEFVFSVWIEELPDIVLQHLTPLALVTLGYFVEKHYVSRTAVFANALAINVHVRDVVSPHQLVVLYANLGLIMAAVGMYTYIEKNSLGSDYYLLAQGYGSPVVACVILLF
ncbi:hypothetical protein ACAH01_08830 [Halomicrobium sp. HM KBTZ05]|uniref:hypothetical protein n=1 Tax=Halomicrobium sp. HM KBTZ05 TaxID=3242663 RepID=UPI003557406D